MGFAVRRRRTTVVTKNIQTARRASTVLKQNCHTILITLYKRVQDLDDAETDELVFHTMRSNSNRSASMTPEFLHRFELTMLRKVVRAAKADGIRLS